MFAVRSAIALSLIAAAFSAAQPSSAVAQARSGPLFYDQRRLPDMEVERRNQEVLTEQRRIADERRLEAEALARKKTDEARVLEENQRRAEDEKRNAEQRLAAESETKRKTEEARLIAETEAKKQAEEDKRLAAETQTRKKSEEARQVAETEARKKADEDKRVAAEAEARKAEDEKRVAAEAGAKKKAEEARLLAEAEARKKAEDARQLAEADAKRKTDEAQRLAAEAEAKKKADDARERAEASQKKNEEARLAALEAQAKKANDDEKKRVAAAAASAATAAAAPTAPAGAAGIAAAPAPTPSSNVTAIAKTPPAQTSAQTAALAPAALAPTVTNAINPGQAAPPNTPCEAAKVARSPLTGGRIQIAIDSPCRRGQTITLQYGGNDLIRKLDANGKATLVLDLFMGKLQPASLSYADGHSEPVDTSSSDLGEVSKVAITWQSPVNLELHAFENGATAGKPGHIWSGSASSAEAAKALATESGRGAGFMSTLGDSSQEGAKTEVYTFFHSPDQRAGVVAISLEFATRGATPSGEYCGSGAKAAIPYEAVTVTPRGTITRERGVIASAPCGTPLTQSSRFMRDAVPDLQIGQ